VSRRFAFFIAWVFFGLGCLVLGAWLRNEQAPGWLAPDTTAQAAVLRPWMVEADCYSQLARVQRILAGQGLIQNHFKVENWPEGLVPSTTAPFDYCILLLYAPLKLFTVYPLDWAGALVSPLLWAGLVVFWMFFRSREFSHAGRAIFLIGSAALPGFVLATECGRPRHQSLLLVLLALGLTAEYERWNMVVTPRRAWSIFAGVVWGMACWTSLFEPIFVVTVLIAFNLIVRRRESPAMLISYGVVMLVALLLEGLHFFVPPPEYREALRNWLATIAEVRGLSFGVLAQQMTLGLLLLPFVAWPLWLRENSNRTDRLLILLTVILTFFTAVQSRWIYYANLGELFLVARFFQMTPTRWSWFGVIALMVFTALLVLSIPLHGIWNYGLYLAALLLFASLYPLGLTRWPRLAVLIIFLAGLADAVTTQVTLSRKTGSAQPSLELLQISRSIDHPGGILAPWWLSPGLLYFSGQPIVTGSSHCGISGIVAGAQFYTATSWIDAENILKARQVRWIVVYDDPKLEYPVLNTSRGILGMPFVTYEDSKAEADKSVAQTLNTDRFVPTWLHLRRVTQQMKLYEYVPVAER